MGLIEDAVVECLEGNASVGELAFGILMAIEAQLGIERKIAAELQEERAEIPVQRIDVIVVYPSIGPIEPGFTRARHEPAIGATK
jgi:hypothetical protein